MKPIVLTPMLASAITFSVTASGSSFSFPRSTPEAQGISSVAITRFVQAADEQVDAMNSFMLVRHGHVVAEGWWTPYGAEIRHELYSLSKSFTSTAVGMAVADGKMSLDDLVLAGFPGDAPAEPGLNLKAMRVRDLLRMTTGQDEDTVKSFSFHSQERLTREFLALPVAHKPGTLFVYNTAATYMLSALVQKATGSTVLDYLQPRLFEPLGIQNPTWETSAQGISLGGYGLSIRTEDIARLGQFYLQKGMWQGKQLLPATWVQAATSRQTSNGSDPKSDWEQGYGYQFWRCRHGLYRGDGAFGQFCIVMPRQDAVVAITSGTTNMASVMNLVWDRLLPAFEDQALPANEDACDNLRRILGNLQVRTQTGAPSSPTAPEVAGKKFIFATNNLGIESISLVPGNGKTDQLLAGIRGVEYQISCGHGEWQKGRMAFGMLAGQPAAATGGWTAPDTYAAKICFYETPYYVTLRLRYADGALLLDSTFNVSLGTREQPRLTGRPSN